MSVEEEEARVPPGADLERYVRELAEFVGLGEADAAVIRESAWATPPRPRPTSWEFIASVSTT